MNALAAALKRIRRPAEDRGSAMLISMLVMVILTLIGVSFLVFSQTEEGISINERNDYQVLYIAEAGANVVKSWFNSPNRAKNPLVPTTSQMILNQRKGNLDYSDTTDPDTIDSTSSSGDRYLGGWRSGGRRHFDQPFRPNKEETFLGKRDWPDVLIDLQVDGGSYLNTLNRLFNKPGDRSLGVPKIIEIRVYRPPIARDIGLRLGVATIEVTAIKELAGKEFSRRVVRDVIQEYPFPGPRGAIESTGLIRLQGNFQPHWGLVESEQDMDVKWTTKWWASIPRENPTSTPAYGDQLFWDYVGFNPAIPLAWHGSPAKSNLMRELLGITQKGNNCPNCPPPWIEDPWLKARCARRFIGSPVPPNTDKQPWRYNIETSIRTVGADSPKYTSSAPSDIERSNALQGVTVKFPVVKYSIWKAVALSGEKGIRYFTYAGAGPLFKEKGIGPARSFPDWVNVESTTTKNQPGVYFFDTRNSEDPQTQFNAGATGQLTETIRLAPGRGTPFLMEGFIYTNAQAIDSSGLGNGVDIWVNMPGEPFLDWGLDLDGDGCVPYCGPTSPSPWPWTACKQEGVDPSCSLNQDEFSTFRNEVWDVVFAPNGTPPYASDGKSFYLEYDDTGTKSLAFQGFETDHRFANRVIPHSNPAGDTPAPWNPAECNHGNFRCHEAFVNLEYPAVPTPSKGILVRTDFDIDATAARPIDVGVNTSGRDDRAANTPDPGTKCLRKTTSACDRDGGMYKLNLHLKGIFYNEGSFEGTGNFIGYGSLLMYRGFSGSGTIDMYFDQSIMKNVWPPEEFNLPRVFVSSRETE